MGALEKALGGAITREERTTPTGSTCSAPTIQRQKLWVNFHSIVNRFGIDLDHFSEFNQKKISLPLYNE